MKGDRVDLMLFNSLWPSLASKVLNPRGSPDIDRHPPKKLNPTGRAASFEQTLTITGPAYTAHISFGTFEKKNSEPKPSPSAATMTWEKKPFGLATAACIASLRFVLYVRPEIFPSRAVMHDMYDNTRLHLIPIHVFGAAELEVFLLPGAVSENIIPWTTLKFSFFYYGTFKDVRLNENLILTRPAFE